MKYLILPVLLISFIGCTRTETVYVDRPVEVKVPVKCIIPTVEAPKKAQTYSESLLNIKEYIEKLQEAVKVCQ